MAVNKSFSSLIPLRPLVQFNDQFSQTQQKAANYRRWSERASVMSYNSNNGTYDIVITTQRVEGSDTRITQRIIRGVKSIQANDTGLFGPGDAVLVGYVADAREHPIILGAGDHTSQKPPVVTLPGSGAGATASVEGEVDPDGGMSPQSQSPCQFKLKDLGTGSTQSVTVDCSDLQPDGSFDIPDLFAECGVGNISWGSAGASISTSGPNNSRAKIKPATNSGPGVAGTAYKLFATHSGALCSQEGGRSYKIEERDCNDQFISCTNVSWFFPCCEGPCGLGGNAFNYTCMHPTPDTAPSNCSSTSMACCECAPPVPPFGNPCDNIPTGKGSVCDTRTQSMIDQGCRPCNLIDGTLITATDANGNQVTTIIKSTGSTLFN